MGQQIRNAIGLDYDSQSIRAVKLSCGQGKSGDSDYKIVNTAELRGNFNDESTLVEALKRIREKISITPLDKMVTCVSGKQTYAAQIPVRKLPEEEMKSMLKLEMRKTIPFEVSGATVDFQFLPADPVRKSDAVQVMVSAVSNILLNKHLRTFEKAGIRPHVVDVLPLAVANAFWALRKENRTSKETQVVIHVGPKTSTLVIDGDNSAFFNRSIYFNAYEIFGDQSEQTVSAEEAQFRMDTFAGEIMKSLTFYESTYQSGKFTSIYLLGNFAAHRLCDALTHRTGLTAQPIETIQKLNHKKPLLPGKYDLSAALAMRAG